MDNLNQILKRSNRESIFTTTYTKLTEKYNIEIPQFQRIVNKNRVDKIYESIKKIMKNGEEPFLPSCIVICKTKDSYYVVDGNHRYEVIKRLYEIDNFNLTFFVNWIDLENINDVEKIFKMVNNSIPLEELPEGIKINQINPIKFHFMKKYSYFFSDKKNPYRPSISENLFGEVIGKIIKNNSNLTSLEIINKIEEFNLILSTKNSIFFQKKSENIASIDNAIIKAHNKGEFYLGLFHTKWPEKLFEFFGSCDNEIKHEVKIVNVRKKIPKPMRINVWNNYVGIDKRTGKCPFCTNIMFIEEFEVGHDIPLSKGGSYSIDNLFPLCSGCNKSMGTKNYEEMRNSLKHYNV